jgi:hypothetical protein
MNGSSPVVAASEDRHPGLVTLAPDMIGFDQQVLRGWK